MTQGQQKRVVVAVNKMLIKLKQNEMEYVYGFVESRDGCLAEAIKLVEECNTQLNKILLHR